MMWVTQCFPEWIRRAISEATSGHCDDRGWTQTWETEGGDVTERSSRLSEGQ